MLLVLVWHPSQKTNPVPSALRGSRVKFWAGIQGPFVHLGMRKQTFVIGRESGDFKEADVDGIVQPHCTMRLLITNR